MKFEIEVTEDVLIRAITRKVITEVADLSNLWSSDQYIKARIKEYWKGAVDALIQDALKDEAVLREKVTKEMERKLRSQLAEALKK